MDLSRHIDRELGVPEEVFVVEGPHARFKICQIDGKPQRDAVTYVTEGINAAPLKQPSGSLVRQEFVLAVRRTCVSDDARRPIGTVADSVFGSGQAAIRGEVIDGPGPMIPGSTLTAACCLAPAILPQSFWLYPDSDPATMFVWLVPLTPGEAELARRVGPDEFEGHLADAQDSVDLLDLRRPEFIT